MSSKDEIVKTSEIVTDQLNSQLLNTTPTCATTETSFQNTEVSKKKSSKGKIKISENKGDKKTELCWPSTLNLKYKNFAYTKRTITINYDCKCYNDICDCPSGNDCKCLFGCICDDL